MPYSIIPPSTPAPARFERPTAEVTCAYCPWRAKHTADTIEEVGTFLHRLVVAHVADLHQDKAL